VRGRPAGDGSFVPGDVDEDETSNAGDGTLPVEAGTVGKLATDFVGNDEEGEEAEEESCNTVGPEGPGPPEVLGEEGAGKSAKDETHGSDGAEDAVEIS